MALCYVSPSAVASLTFGDGYPGAEDLLGPYALAMLVLAVASVPRLYRLAWARHGWPACASPLRRRRPMVMWVLRGLPPGGDLDHGRRRRWS